MNSVLNILFVCCAQKLTVETQLHADWAVKRAAAQAAPP
jgi:hypothetical protein